MGNASCRFDNSIKGIYNALRFGAGVAQTAERLSFSYLLASQSGGCMATPRKPRALCLCGCKRQVSRPSMMFFSNKCQQDWEYQHYIGRWKTGLETGSSGVLGSVSNHIKRYLREKYKDRCPSCGWSERHPLTQTVPLEVDHMNGDSSDNREENLRMLCPNCHALTLNYRALNKGNGRVNRR
jgi:hypothetical protein